MSNISSKKACSYNSSEYDNDYICPRTTDFWDGRTIIMAIITNLEIIAIKTNTATIRFDVDTATKCQIEYGITTSYGNITPADNYSFFHVV